MIVDLIVLTRGLIRNRDEGTDTMELHTFPNKPLRINVQFVICKLNRVAMCNWF